MDILKGVDKMIQGGNVSAIFSPVSNEHFLPQESQFFNGDMLTALKRGNFKKVRIQLSFENPSNLNWTGIQVPMLNGIVTDEGMLLGYFLKETLDKLAVSDIP